MSLRDRLLWLPNLITLARLLSVPVMVYLMLEGVMTASFWLFLAAGLSDAIDGYLAKRWRLETVTGAYLDPIADKALLVACYLTLGHLDVVPVWLVILVVFRDLLIVGGAALYHHMTQALRMQPLFVSKVNTCAQIALVGVVLAEQGLALDLSWLRPALVWGVAATTFLSGTTYVVTWGKRALSNEQDR